MKKQIIVNINPFNIEKEVVAYAVKIARRLDLPLLLYSVQRHTVMPIAAEPGGQMVPIDTNPPDWDNSVKEKTANYCEQVKRMYPNTTYEHDLGLLGDSVTSKLNDLYKSASERSPYLLIMPKSNEYNWWNDLIGTAETAIAADAPCPVLFVPNEAELAEVNRFFYLADKESLENYDYPGFKTLKAMSANLGADISVGFIPGDEADNSHYNSTAAMTMLRRSMPSQEDYEYRFLADMSAEEVLKVAKLTHADIVAFPFREAGLFERFFDEEITRVLVLKANLPVLVF